MAFQTGGETGTSFQSGGEVQQNALQGEQAGRLIDQLRQSRSALRKHEVVSGIVQGDPKGRRLSAESQQANQQLLDAGFTQNQIDLTLSVKEGLDPIKIGRPLGGLAGSIAVAAAIPGPFDDIAIAGALLISAGAGLGGVAGEAAQTGLQEKRLISKREALSAFANESLTELGGRGLVGTTKFVFSPFIKKVVPEAAALVDDFAKVGGTFSPSELDSRFSIRVGEAFARGSFGAKQIFQDFEEQQGRAVLAFSDNILESIGQGVARLPREELGQVFADGITRPGGRVFNILDDLFNPLFKQVDDIAQAEAQAGFRQVRAGGTIKNPLTGKFQATRELQRIQLKPSVSTSGLKKFAQKQLATDKRLNGQFLSPAGRSKLEGVLGLNDKLSFSDMRTLRTSFLKDVQKMAREVDQSQGIIKQLAGLTDAAIFDPRAAKGLSPKAVQLLENTNALYKQAQKGLETTFSEKLAKRLVKNPSNVIREVFPNKNPKAIRLLRESLVEPISGKPSAEGKVLWNQLRQAWLADAVGEATKTGVANPKLFDNIIRLAGDNLKEMFPDDIGLVKRIQSLMQQAGKGPPAGTSLFSRGAQAAGAIQMYSSGRAGDFIGFAGGGILAIGPLAFAKLATNPKGIKFLTAGLKIPPGSKKLVPHAIRMIRVLREINRKEQQPALQAERKKKARLKTQRFIKSQPIPEFGGLGGSI